MNKLKRNQMIKKSIKKAKGLLGGSRPVWQIMKDVRKEEEKFERAKR